MRTILPLLLLTFTLTACEQSNIHKVVKEIAEAPVDTTGLPSQTIRTNSFSAVDIDCFADVTFHPSTAVTVPYVRLRANNEVLNNVTTRVESGVLIISTNRRYRMPEKEVLVLDIYSPYVSRFTLNGVKCLRMGRVNMASPFALEIFGVGAVTADSLAAPEVKVTAGGTASVDLRGITTNLLRAKITGKGRIYLSGQSRKTVLSPGAEGMIDTSALHTERGK